MQSHVGTEHTTGRRGQADLSKISTTEELDKKLLNLIKRIQITPGSEKPTQKGENRRLLKLR
jgi:hypothetical protein